LDVVSENIVYHDEIETVAKNDERTPNFDIFGIPILSIGKYLKK